MCPKFTGHYFHSRMTGSVNFLHLIYFAIGKRLSAYGEDYLRDAATGFTCVCVSSENKACGNLLELTNKPLNRLNFWLKCSNSLNLPFQVLQNTEC